MVDERLGRYVVLRKLATGGMADVFLARTAGIEGFERHVVLKRIRSDYAGDARFTSMFLDEAKLAATLHHHNIVQVFDIGEEAGEYFFTMEYLHGEDLRTLLDEMVQTRSHVPLGHLVAIGAASAAGLHYAHERRGADRKPLGIVHRDVSPSNIIVGFDGSVKLVDFGIARAAMRAPEPRIEGKLGYMSPEQLTNRPIDRRSDVYSLGVVLYELATTGRLFAGGETDEQMVDAIVNGRIPLPRVRRPDLPNELSVILMRALAADPDRRYQSAGELREALDQYASRAGVAVSGSVLADYMRKVFGEQPEPWLERPPSRRTGSVRSFASGTRSKPLSKPPTRTTAKLGWETTPVPQKSTWTVARVAALLTIPLLAIIALLVAKLAGSDRIDAPEEPPASVASSFATVDPQSPPPAVAPPRAKLDEAPVAPAQEPKRASSARKRAAAASEPQLPTVISEGVHVIKDPDPPAVEAPPPPPPPPPPVEPAPVELSSAVVQAVASDHARELAKCEGTETLHGEIAVRFQIDANGGVTKSQISSSLRKPIIEGCILRSVQRWRFPKQTQPGVRGVYSLSFQ